MRYPLPFPSSLLRTLRATTPLVLALTVLLALPVFTTGNLAAAQEAPIQGVEGRSELVAGQYIVVFAPGVSNPRQAARQIARANGFRVRHVYTRALQGFSARIPDNVLPFVQRDSRIAYVEQDRTVHLVSQTLPAGIDRIDADLDATANIDNVDDPMDVDVAIIDTGIDLDHPDLNIAGEGINCLDSAASADDDNGHGTHVGGTVAARDNTSHVVGVAPGAWLWPVKVLDSGGSGTISSVVCGIDFVTANAANIEVANMSLGAQGVSDTMRTAIQNSVAAGVFYAVAAGNDARDVYGNDGVLGTSDDFIPASYPEVAAVSAMADFDGQAGGDGGNPVFIGCGRIGDDTFASCFSNFSASVVLDNPVVSPGAAIDLAAPGVSVLSTTNDGSTGTMTGTSMASPHVAGGAALRIVADGLVLADEFDVATLRQLLIDDGQPQSLWQSGDTDDPDANPEPLLFFGDTGSSDPVTDVAVSSVSAPSSVTVGDVVSVDVTVDNVGNQDAGSFDVTLTDTTDGVTIGTQTVSGLTAGASTTLTYSWDTTGASLQDHLLEGSHDLADDDSSNDSATTTVTVTDSTSTEVTVDGIDPNSGQAGTSVDVTITGSGFASGADVTLENGSGPTPDVTNIVVSDSGTITATIVIKSGGPPRNRVWDVRVTNADGSSGVLVDGFTVTP